MELRIETTDLTVASLIVGYLNEDPRVVFAAFRRIHPLEDKVEVVIKTNGEDPRKVLEETKKKVLEDLNQVEEALG